MSPRERKRLFSISLLLITGFAAVSNRVMSADRDQREVTTLAREVLNRRCFTCHGANGVAQKNVFILDRDRLITSGAVVPGNASSLLLKMVDSDAMPPGGPPLSEIEKLTLRQWVLAGAPSLDDSRQRTTRPFLSEAAIATAIRQDILSQPARSRSFIRYFSLAHLYNAGTPDTDLDSYRAALGKLINSLSWQREITRPAAIDAAQTIFRIDLRDYNWTAATWNLLLASYPYSLGAGDASTIERLSGAPVPYVRADWFAAHASVPPLYHDLLGLPRSVAELEAMLGVDSRRDLAEENISRAAVRASGVSQNNRLLERHASLYGAYWKSFDFRNSLDQQNVFQNPLSFDAAGSEIVFNLPNGLQAYFVADGLGHRISEAPVAIVSDRTNPDDPVIRNGRSCMSCHYDGVRGFRDEVRAVISQNVAAPFDREKALAIYPPQETLDRMIERDRERFRSAVTLAASFVAKAPQQEPVNALARRFAADLSVEEAAAEVGLDSADFRERVSRSTLLETLGYGQLLVPGGAIKRDAWDKNFEQLASELRLNPIRAFTAPGRIAQTGTVNRVVSTLGITRESVLRAARTISISSMTMFLKRDQLEDELRKRPEFEAMGLAIVKDSSKADLMIDLDRPVFTYTFTYSMSTVDTRVVVVSGKVIAFDGNLAAPLIAKEILKQMQMLRGEAIKKDNKTKE